MDKTLIKDKKEFKWISKYWKNSTYNHYEFTDEEEPISYPCIAIKTSFSVPDTYLTEHSISFVYLTDFN